MKAIFSLTILALACSGGPCEYTTRDYEPPPFPENGLCLGMLASRGAVVSPHDALACETTGGCTLLTLDHYLYDQFPLYWVSGPEVGQPLYAEVSCSVRDCETIERAYASQGQ